MKIIIQNIRQGTGEIGQIDLTHIARDRYSHFAETVNEITKTRLVPDRQPSTRGYFPAAITQQVYLDADQELRLRQLLKLFNTLHKLNKTFFIL